MTNEPVSAELLHLLNQALARELQVCIQYMLQHGIGAGQATAPALARSPSDAQHKFIASHASVWLPGASLKKIAITEMRHAEAIAERVTQLGAAPTTAPAPVVLGQSPEEMLTHDLQQESGAIELYRRIVALAGQEGDRVTLGLFQHILADEQQHHRTFAGLLGRG